MRLVILSAVVALGALAVGCGEDEDPNPNGARTQSGLSTTFTTACANCHGPEGRGKDKYPAIPGSRDESSFIAIVRAGRGDMPATDPSRMTDADLKADYLWLTTKRQ